MSKNRVTETILIVASHDYEDRTAIIGYIQALRFDIGVMTGDQIGVDRFIESVCGMANLAVRKYSHASVDNIVKMVARVVIFYKKGSDHERLKDIRTRAIDYGKPIELYMVGSDGKSREATVKRPETTQQTLPETTDRTPESITASSNPARLRAMETVEQLPGWKKGSNR